MADKELTETRIHLDNGFDFFFSDDEYYGFKSVEQAISQGLRLCLALKSNVKVVLCKTYSNSDYTDKTICSYNYKNIVEAKKIKL